MNLTREEVTTTTVRVNFDEGEKPDVTKSFTSKVIRLDSIRLRVTRESNGHVDERIYGTGHRVLQGGRLGASDSLGQFGISVRELPEQLLAAYQAARAAIELPS
jgi:hypothetical protein